MIPALIVGGYTAWFLGMRTGVIAAVAVAVGLLAAALLPIPGATFVVWALIAGWCGALFFFGRKLAGDKQVGKSGLLSDLGSMAGSVAGSLASRARKLIAK